MSGGRQAGRFNKRRRSFISTKNQRCLRKIHKPAAALMKANIRQFLAILSKSTLCHATVPLMSSLLVIFVWGGEAILFIRPWVDGPTGQGQYATNFSNFSSDFFTQIFEVIAALTRSFLMTRYKNFSKSVIFGPIQR